MANTAAPQRDLEPEQPLPAHSHADAGFNPVAFVRGAIKNTPWIVIAVVIHVIAFAVMGVWMISSHKAEEQAAPASVTVTKKAEEEAVEPDTPPPEIIDRNAIPKYNEAQQEGPVNPDEVIIPDAAPGRRGEITDNTDPNKEPGEFNPDPEAPANLPSGATGGTAIGVGKVGHFGTGKPSAFVSRRAGAGGRGGGGLGQGGGGGSGGATKQTETSVMWALRWLKNHQSPGGNWSGAGFDAQCKMNRCDGPGESTYDPGQTGLALLCFLGAGETHQSGTCRETVKNGLKYLRDVQDSEGCYGPRTSQHFMYNHACAALAMTEAYGMTGSRVFKEPAQRGVGFALKAKNPYLAWRYNFPPDGDNDTSVTGWMVMVLKSAIMSELEVEKAAIKDAVAWVEKMTEPEFGRTGYQQRGGPPARTNEMMAKFPADKSEAMTAAGVLIRIFAGHTTKDDEFILKGADLMVKKLPKWDVDAGTIDFYYWYYATLAMFQVGGEHWKKWNDAMTTAIIKSQRMEPDRCERGSWDPIDCWSPEGGRIYATTLNCLCMEVYYRYGRVMGVDITRGSKDKPGEKK
jgi:hypothetical protein